MRALLYGLAGAALAAGAACAQTATTAPRPGMVGDNNDAVATTSESQPAKGANSFTETEARHRMEAKGYANISGLSKNDDGVWVGKAEKNGRSTTVWLDYKGNVGERM